MIETAICKTLVQTCIKAMRDMKPGENLLLSIKNNAICSATSVHINTALQQEILSESNPDGSFMIRAGNVFAIAAPEDNRWKVQVFFLWIESTRPRSIDIEAKPLTQIGTLADPPKGKPEYELPRILSLFSLV